MLVPRWWRNLTKLQQRRIIAIAITLTAAIITSVIVFEITLVLRRSPPVPYLSGGGSSLIGNLLQSWLDDFRGHYGKKAVQSWRYNATTALEGVTNLENGVISFAGIDDPTLSAFGGAGSKYKAVALAAGATFFAYNVPECNGKNAVVASLSDLIDIYSHPGLIWSDLYNRHPDHNLCLKDVSRPIIAFYRTQPCGSNYVVQNVFRATDPVKWPNATLEWRGTTASPFGFIIPRADFMQQLVHHVTYSIAYIPASTSMFDNKDYPISFLSIINAGNPVAPNRETIQNNRYYDDKLQPISNCTGCWPVMGTGYFTIPLHTTVPEKSVMDPLVLNSCVNLRAVLDFWSWALADNTVSSRSDRFYIALSRTAHDRALKSLQLFTCNGKPILKTKWSKSIQQGSIALLVILPMLTFSFCMAVGVFIIKRRELKNASDVRKLARLGAIEDERGAMLMLAVDHSDQATIALDGTEGSNYRPPALTETLKQQNASEDRRLAKILISYKELTIGTMIGSGSFGEVYTGVYQHKIVAVKRIASTVDSVMAQSFLQETRAMIALDHPNILKLLAIAIKEPYTYIVSEYCKYGALDQYLKTQPQRATNAHKLQLMIATAEGMAYLHSKNMTHRDLKPSNLLVNEDFVLKIGDLGTVANSHNHRTAVGTLDFSAPEVLDGKPYTNSCDVYSFSICLWVIFSNQPLFPDWGMYDIVKKIVLGARPPIDAITSPKLAKLISDCWDPIATNRPQFTEIKIALEDIDPSDFVSYV